MVVVAGCRDTALRCARRRPMSVVGLGEHRRPRAIEGALPGRVLCAERGNPVGVRSVVRRVGKPTVRNAQLPGGNRMTKKPMPAAERRREPRPG
jgi:hypothetical protein